MSKQISIKELNKYLVCSICDGYYRDAFTICDCLHTFCRQCLFDAFNANPKTNKWCPECNTSLSTKPKIVYDRNLQSCVDKLFPEFLKKEQKEQEVDTQNEAKRKLAAKEVTSEEPAQKKRVLSNREAPSSSSGSGSSSNTNTGTKTFPDVIVTLSIIPSTEKSINAQNTPDITLLVPMNTTTAELRKFIHRKYKKESHKFIFHTGYMSLECP